MRLCCTRAWSCNRNTTSPLASSTNTGGYTATRAQRRVLLTATAAIHPESGRSRPTPTQRSPHQWSHIAHLIRKSTVLSSTSPAMASDTLRPPTQSRSHSHGSHHHHNDNTYLTSTNKSDPGVRITRIGLYVNLGMAITKGAGGYIFNSQAYVLLRGHATPWEERCADDRI